MSDKISPQGQQCAVHLMFGFIPVVKVRLAVPAPPLGRWEWSRWRFANLTEIVALNSELQKTWRR